MGLFYKCPACGDVCEHSILTVDDDDHSEHLMLECTQCGHEWFGTFCKDEPKSEHCNKCPKCGAEELDIVGGPDFAHGSSQEILLVWECYGCGTQFAVLYDLEPRDIEILE